MTTSESRPPLGPNSESRQREQDRQTAAAVVGCMFTRELDRRAADLGHVLESARSLPEDDPRRGVLAMYGQRLLSIVAPEVQIQMPPTEGEQ